MASGLSFLQSAEEDLICPLCLELFIDPHIPKSLDCPHVYCQTCLVTLLAGSRDKQTISCPECRKDTTVPDRDVTNLNTNLRLLSLAEKHEKCMKDTGQNKTVNSIPYCKDHDGERLHFYCLTCQVFVCKACLVLMHERPKHVIKSTKDAHLENMKILEATIKRNEKLISEFRRNIEHITYWKEKIHAGIKESERDIDKACDKAVNEIKEQAQKLKKDLHDKNDYTLERCKEEKMHYQEMSEKLQSAVDNAKKVVEIDKDHEYLDHHKKVAQQFSDLEALRIAFLEDDSNEFCYNPDYDKNTLRVASFGYNDKLLVNLGAIQQKAVRKLELHQTHSFSHPITSIACGYHHIVVNMQSQNLIEVFKLNEGNVIEHKCCLKPTQKDWHPLNVAITDNFNQLVNILVMRWNCVEVFSIQGKHEKTLSRCISPQNQSRTYSVTTIWDGRILAGGKPGYYSSIKCYSPNGQKCGNDITPYVEPRKLEVIEDTYVAASDLRNKVCIHPISDDSGYPFLYSNVDNYTIGSLITIPNPTALCYDCDVECLLVGCKDNNVAESAVIQQYCWESGAKIATIAQGLKNPQDMVFTGETLVVADEDTLKFYKMSTETVIVDTKLWNPNNAEYQAIYP